MELSNQRRLKPNKTSKAVGGGTHPTMSRLFSTQSFCAKCSLLRARRAPLATPQGAQGSPLQRSDGPGVLIQQYRRYVGGSNAVFFRYRSRSWLWLCGVGVGVALAVGLKLNTANISCEDTRKAQRTDRYNGAITVSRDLVERIKVGTEVGL